MAAGSANLCHAQKTKNLTIETTQETPEIFKKVFSVVLLFCELWLKMNFKATFRGFLAVQSPFKFNYGRINKELP